MFFSPLGEPQRLESAVRTGFGQPDHAAVGPHHRAQADVQATDLQCLPLAQAHLLCPGQFYARQTLHERG